MDSPDFELSIRNAFLMIAFLRQAFGGQPSPPMLKTLFKNIYRYFSKDGLPAEALAKAGGGGGSRIRGGSNNHRGLRRFTECLPNERYFYARY